MKVSVCVPVYNAAPYIRRCAESLFRQDMDGLEFIFVNDCSTDGSFDKLKSTISEFPQLKSNITLIENDENLGPGLSRAKAAVLAQGDYLYFPDADDCLDADMLSTLYKRAVEEQCDLVVCGATKDYDDGRSVPMAKYLDISQEEWRKRIILFDKVYVGLCSSLVSNDLYERASEDCLSCRLYALEDYMLAVRFHYLADRMSVVNRYLYHQTVNNPSSISKTYNKQTLESRLAVADNVRKFIMSLNVCQNYKHKANQMAAIIKTDLLIKPGFEDYRRWHELWPELNKARFIPILGPTSFAYKLIVYLASRKQYRLMRTIRLFINKYL